MRTPLPAPRVLVLALLLGTGALGTSSCSGASSVPTSSAPISSTALATAGSTGGRAVPPGPDASSPTSTTTPVTASKTLVPAPLGFGPPHGVVTSVPADQVQTVLEQIEPLDPKHLLGEANECIELELWTRPDLVQALQRDLADPDPSVRLASLRRFAADCGLSLDSQGNPPDLAVPTTASATTIP